MRQLFITCKKRAEAAKAAPWYDVIVKVVGGYMAFESRDDYEMWERQA